MVEEPFKYAAMRDHTSATATQNRLSEGHMESTPVETAFSVDTETTVDEVSTKRVVEPEIPLPQETSSYCCE
ncbi:hypothetical protein K0C01_11125 [Salinarchaeum sp. IM2453]|uniref:hypothetical protein n=1 Tax=Salinarchaeum sp. IM2453 TaxID=2862870 RepID=UPI001C830487|nr:hypothetical protein [Salinarchaeum sp. IM2453]QZA88322.1 hypothetical protein K0C01_11125 [Salinarchaeum sp. IM2453]